MIFAKSTCQHSDRVERILKHHSLDYCRVNVDEELYHLEILEALKTKSGEQTWPLVYFEGEGLIDLKEFEQFELLCHKTI